MRARVSIPPMRTQDELPWRRRWPMPNVQKFVEGKPIRKAIYVTGKLVNIVV